MQDYRYILEKLYEFRGRKSGRNWILYITEIESTSPNERYIEASAYTTFINLKKFLYKNLNKLISSQTIRSFIEKSIKVYDENYIGSIGNILFILESMEQDEETRNSPFFNEINGIFN